MNPTLRIALIGAADAARTPALIEAIREVAETDRACTLALIEG